MTKYGLLINAIGHYLIITCRSVKPTVLRYRLITLLRQVMFYPHAVNDLKLDIGCVTTVFCNYL